MATLCGVRIEEGGKGGYHDGEGGGDDVGITGYRVVTG